MRMRLDLLPALFEECVVSMIGLNLDEPVGSGSLTGTVEQVKWAEARELQSSSVSFPPQHEEHTTLMNASPILSVPPSPSLA